MDHRLAVAIALCLVLYSGSSSGQDDCVTVEQNSITTLLYNSTRLVCRVKEGVKGGFLLLWDIDAKDKAKVERYGHHITVSKPYPDQYACEWKEDAMSSVLTIKRTTKDDEGTWYCNFMADDGCIGSVGVDVTTTCKSFHI